MKIVAAFDFDGTLTYSDSLQFFLLKRFGYFKVLINLIPLLPYFIGFAFGWISRQSTKEAVLTQFFKDISIETLNQWGKEYADGVLNELLRPEIVQKLKWHQNEGHCCILVSASLRFFLQPWADRNGFERLICSELQISSDGKVTGRLDGKNCWGPEKVRRILEVLGPKETFYLYAYGDSNGDKELLDLADKPFLVI